jgi:adenylylsulfate kinase-like enzyme
MKGRTDKETEEAHTKRKKNMGCQLSSNYRFTIFASFYELIVLGGSAVRFGLSSGLGVSSCNRKFCIIILIQC